MDAPSNSQYRDRFIDFLDHWAVLVSSNDGETGTLHELQFIVGEDRNADHGVVLDAKGPWKEKRLMGWTVLTDDEIKGKGKKILDEDRSHDRVKNCAEFVIELTGVIVKVQNEDRERLTEEDSNEWETSRGDAHQVRNN